MARTTRRASGGLPLAPLAPILVVVAGALVAAIVAILGVWQLGETSDRAAADRADALAITLAARLRATPQAGRAEVVDRAARRSGAELLLVEQSGQVVVNESFGGPDPSEVVDMLVKGQGETRTALGRVRFVARPLKQPLAHLFVIAFVAAPSPPVGYERLGYAVLVFAALLLGLAVAVTLSFTRTAQHDVDYVRQRIEEMAGAGAGIEDIALSRPSGVFGRTSGMFGRSSVFPSPFTRAPVGEPVPVRSLDQVGVLTAAFNALVARFAQAEAKYVADLAQAGALDKERTTFLAGLSHELRTPLNAILGFAHLLESEVDGPLSDEAREHVAIVRTSGEHLRTLINDILDLSALETGKLDLMLAPVEVRAIAEQVLREASAALRHKPVELSLVAPERAYAMADRVRLRQILTNLVSNALKFTERGAVIVEVKQTASKIELAVTDTGPGIAKEDQAAVFEVYKQTEEAARKRGGAGLGLAITRRLVEMHRGEVSLASEVGRGSTFRVTLPASDPPPGADRPGSEGLWSGGADRPKGLRQSFFSVTDVRERSRFVLPDVPPLPPPVRDEGSDPT